MLYEMQNVFIKDEYERKIKDLKNVLKCIERILAHGGGNGSFVVHNPLPFVYLSS